MQLKTLGTTLLLLTAGLTLVAGTAAADEYACSNYGVQTQVTVTGDNNNMNCNIQHCEQGPTGAAGVGVGVGTAAGEGEAGGEASAGTSCTQTGGDDPSDPGNGCGDIALLRSNNVDAIDVLDPCRFVDAAALAA